MMNCFEMVPANSEQILNLTVDGKESLSLLDRLEPSHLPLLFPGMLMRDFSPVVLVLTRSMLNRGEKLTMGSRIAPEFVSDQLPGSFTLALQHFAKEAFSSLLVSSLRHQNIENIAVLIHCSPKVELLSLNLHEQLIDVPDVAQSALLLSDRARVSWPELLTPEADCLVGDDDPSFGQQILDVSKAECEAVVEPHGMTDDLGRESMVLVPYFHSAILAERYST